MHTNKNILVAINVEHILILVLVEDSPKLENALTLFSNGATVSFDSIL